MDKEKLAKLQAQAQATRIGGKTTLRRKVVKKSASTQQSSDIKLQAGLKKLGVAPITGVEEVNMFKEDGNVLHFQRPIVNAALPNNTLAIHGAGQTKELTELVPGILNQLGPDSLASLRKLAESYQSMTARGAGAGENKEAEDDDEIPDLVESFDEEAEGGEEKKLDDVE